MTYQRAPGDTQDLATLTDLDESSLLSELKARHAKGEVYTYVGDILVAINPFRKIDIYRHEEHMMYRNASNASLPPHIFALADSAFKAMKTDVPQCFVISGESGAGKTETAKQCIRHIMNLCQGDGNIGSAQGRKLNLETQILQINPLLEAFGNAKTGMNDNSSRFGKYTELVFNLTSVTGAEISQYLLEKSRLVNQEEGEQNFHVLYYMFASPDKDKYRLTSPDEFPYMSHPADLDKKYIAKEYQAVLKALEDVGFTPELIHELHSVLAAVLHLGNVMFHDTEEGDPSKLEEESVETLEFLATLIGVPENSLPDALTVNRFYSRGEVFERPFTRAQAEDCRDALAKGLYGKTFGWIVSKINQMLKPNDAVEVEMEDRKRLIGILDIFGFEKFQVNSFEQWCINLANEQLQNYFNEHVFKQELEMYEKEGVSGANVSYVDNRPLLDMYLTKPVGLMSLLDEETHMPKASDYSLVRKFENHFSSHDLFTPATINNCTFTLTHYAGQVEYTAFGFLEKNRDNLAMDLVEVLQKSTVNIVVDAFCAEVSKTGQLKMKGMQSTKKRPDSMLQRGLSRKDSHNSSSKTIRGTSVGGAFKNSLHSLITKMIKTQPHFVRCIKPNAQQVPHVFEEVMVEAQLKYTGMLETIRIRKQGYSVRPTFVEFVDRFRILAFQFSEGVKPDGEAARKILEAAGCEEFLLGKSRAFLKYQESEKLDTKVAAALDTVENLQKVARGFVARCKVRALLKKKREEEAATAAAVMELYTTLNANTETFSRKFMSLPMQLPGAEPEPEPEEEAEPPVVLPPPPAELLAAPHGTTQEWWQENELQRGAGQSSVGQFHIWFHGILSRRAAEMLLQGRPNGTFLVRVSESRYGYSLSFQSGVRCKHYIIDQTLDGRYCVAGKDFFAETLLDLVTHFKTTPLNEEADVLSIPCGQADENNPDFQHLLPQGHTVAAAPRDYSNPSTPAAEAKKKQSFGDLQDYGESDPNAPPPVASGGMGGNSRPQMNLPPPAMRALKPGAQPEGEYGTLPARAPAALPPPVVRSNKPQLAT